MSNWAWCDRARCVLVRVVLLAAGCVVGTVAYADQGQWTPAVDWSYASGEVSAYAIHMVLLPGDGQPYHSRLLWWNGHKADGFAGREMGWLPGTEGCDSFPSSRFRYIGAPGMPESHLDIFCSGHAALADGRLFTPGGTSQVTGIYGEKRTRLFQAGSGTSQGEWTDPGDMSEWRWYPTATTLRDGRVLISSGSRHRHHRFFGGLRNGAAPGATDTVFRFAPVAEGAWESPVRPAADQGQRPVGREGHTAVETFRRIPGFDDAQVLFGGRKADSTLLNDLWLLKRDPNVAGTDYAYEWDERVLQTSPQVRSEHSAIAVPGWDGWGGMLVIFGGLTSGNTSRGDVWRLMYKNNALQWSELHITNPGSAPSARFGHAAVFDARAEAGQVYRRMLLFGGSAAVGQAPSDANVYELRFDNQRPDTATWHTMTQSGSPRPPATYRHSLSQVGDGIITGYGLSYLYGGIKSNGEYSDTLWSMSVQSASTVNWVPTVLPAEAGGQTPGKRARHSAVWDPNQGRLYVFGGQTPSGQADSSVYIAFPQNQWERWASPGFALAGHTVVLDGDITMARWPDLFDPAAPGGSQFQQFPNVGLFQLSYPPVFVVPGGTNDSCRVISIAPLDYAYQLNVPRTGAPGPWRKLTNAGFSYFSSTGVSYRPGTIMLTEDAGSGVTKTLETGNVTNSWQASGSMLPRSKHNLVLLPTGQVLAVGGIASTGEPSNPVVRPQIWYPDSNGVGVWSDTTSGSRLSKLIVKRNYHSTAILLPDGRVLSGGGDGELGLRWQRHTGPEDLQPVLPTVPIQTVFGEHPGGAAGHQRRASRSRLG